MSKQLLVAQVIDNYTLILNKGLNDGIKENQKYLVYKLGDIFIDPETQEDLGRWEIIRGKGEIIEVRDKYSVLKSRNLSNALISFSAALTGAYKYSPFESPQRGDIAKLIED